MPRVPRRPVRAIQAQARARQRGDATRTIQRAYRKRKQFRKNLQPFVETKTDTTGTIDGDGIIEFVAWVPPVLATKHMCFMSITPDCYLYAKQGSAANEMVGDSLYSRYLTTKVQFRFPQNDGTSPGSALLIRAPYEVIVYQGWIKDKVAATDYSVPLKTEMTNAIIQNHVDQRLSAFWDKTSNRLEFNEKMEGIKIIRRLKIKPDHSHAVNYQSVTGTNVWRSDTNVSLAGFLEKGGPPDVYKTFKWNTKRKLHYQESENLEGTNDHYINREWIPFLAIYCPQQWWHNPSGNNDSAPTSAANISFAHMSRHWYGDQ